MGRRPIPTAPSDVVVGIPAELLERRPDIRSAERAAAAQAEQIGIAQADLYPHISITGTLGYSAMNASQLFTPAQLQRQSWGRRSPGTSSTTAGISNNVRLQDATFQQALLDYRTAVLTANQEAEDGLVAFLRSQEQRKLFAEGVVAAKQAYQIVVSQYQVGTVDYTRLAQVQGTMVSQEDSEAQARGAIALGLIEVYRALGGGWEIRLGPAPASGLPPPGALAAHTRTLREQPGRGSVAVGRHGRLARIIYGSAITTRSARHWVKTGSKRGQNYFLATELVLARFVRFLPAIKWLACAKGPRYYTATRLSMPSLPTKPTRSWS